MMKLKAFATEDLSGFMDEGTEFLGELRFRDTFRVDGKIKGKIVSEHTLIVGEPGMIDAEVDCGIVSIRGVARGRICGRQKIELLAGSRVSASLSSPRVVIEEGAFFEGDCDMAPPAPAAVLALPQAVDRKG